MTTLKITHANKHKYIDEFGNLTVPEGIQIVKCFCLQLTSLVVPKGIKKLNCSFNKLTSLIVPEGLQKLDCSHNNLTSLTVPEGIQELDCSHNNLTSLVVPGGAQELWCSYNKLIYIDFKTPKNLKHLNIKGNENLVYPPIAYAPKPTKEIMEWCTSHKMPQRLHLQQRYKERWNIIRLMYIAHYGGGLDSKSSNFNKIPIEVITGIITRYVLT